MKRRNIIFITLSVFSFLLLGCSRADKGYEVESDYEFSTEAYILQDDNNNISIEYPLILGLSDEDKQKEINETIKAEALKVYNYYDYEDRGHLELDVVFNVTLESESTLSIQYYGFGFEERAAHPNKLFYTTNIDLQTGAKLKLVDLVNVNDEFVDLFTSWKFNYVGPLGEIDSGDFDTYYGTKESFESADNMEAVFSYLTEDSLGISIPVAHAVGGFAMFEIKYEAIEAFINF